ncbi:Arogenate dehydrogenase 1, chloroplastic [Glycine soja]|uniref:Arogenate dehydrogenase 1, chloroplastic n=1 Tax=Glycine soja TaxID=3848 RepID=A0A445H512_GLYSO|nr:Arogenate dehydrogenase 1, chloroplastic [Glycine soja]
MFGPESGKNGWNGLAFVYDKVRIGIDESRTSRCDRFLDIFASEGCRMVEMSCAEHDWHAAGSQFITHTTGRFLEKLELERTPIDTKGYETLLSLVENTAGDSFDLYYGLFLYNINAMEQIERFDRAFESVKKQLFDPPPRNPLHVTKIALFSPHATPVSFRHSPFIPLITPFPSRSHTTAPTIAGAILGLIFFLPLIILSSPVWVPAGTLVFIVTAGFLSVCGFGVALVAALSWMYRYFRGLHPPGSDRVDYARTRIYDTASHVKDYARDYRGYLQSKVKDAAPEVSAGARIDTMILQFEYRKAGIINVELHICFSTKQTKLNTDEFYCKNGKSLESMNMDEFLSSIWNSDDNNQVNPPLSTLDEAGKGKSVVATKSTTISQPLSVPLPICKKTVDEIWSQIHKS